MDRAIWEAKHANMALRKGLQKLMKEENEEHTEIDLLKSAFKVENRGDEKNYRRRHLQDLKENVNEIRSKTYQLPARHTGVPEVRVVEGRPSGGVDGAENAREVQPQRETQKPSERDLWDSGAGRRDGGNEEPEDVSAARGQRGFGGARLSAGATKSTDDTRHRRLYGSFTPDRILEHSEDPFMDDIVSPPRDNLLINKLIHQNEIIETLNQQLRQTREENRRMKSQKHETESSKLAFAREKELEVEQFKREFRRKQAAQDKEPLLSQELSSLKQELQAQKELTKQAEDAVVTKEHDIEKLREASVHLSIKLVANRSSEKDAQRVIEGLRFSNRYLKTFIDGHVVELQKQLETLGKHIISDEGDLAESETHEENTTSLLLRDNTTSLLIHNNREKFTVDQFLASQPVGGAKTASLKKYALAALFVARAANAVQFKHEMQDRISSLA